MSSSGASSNGTNSKRNTMTYGQFMAMTPEGVEGKVAPPYAAFGNPGYDSAGYKINP
jgi:hypothetical protein